MSFPFSKRPLAHCLLAALLAAGAAPCVLATPADKPTSTQFQSVIDSSLRTADDKKGDAKRKPAEFLAFAMVKPGMKALDVASGGGATAQLLAAAVGSAGSVWAQTGKPSEAMEKRLAAAPQANFHPVVKGFDNPVPDGVSGLDLITINMSYHDIVNTPTDRGAMNKHLLDALRPGGHLVIIDNAANAGTGLNDTKTLHRIEKKAVMDELVKAGFVLDGESDYLAVPGDPRKEPFFKMDGKPDDKFALRFVKK